MMLSSRLRPPLVTMVVLTFFLISGCGKPSGLPELTPIRGRITLDGKPAPGITIVFNPVSQGRPTYGYTGADGSYVIKYTTRHAGAVVGPNRVVFQGADGLLIAAKPADDSWTMERDGSIPVTVDAQTKELNFDLVSTRRRAGNE